MREIKFRSWVESEKFSYMNYNIEFTGGLINDIFAKSGKEPQSIYGSKITYMQYTGLKDCNGVDIYEGDILSTDLSRRYLTVEFRNGAFVFQCHDEGNDYYDTMTSVNSVEVFKTEYLKVIGNIYENKDLLI